MSVDIRDWPELCKVLNDDLFRTLVGCKCRLSGQYSILLKSIDGNFESVSPKVEILGFKSTLPSKFIEILPPSSDTFGESSLLIIAKLTFDGEAGGRMSASLCLDYPCENFAQFPVDLSISQACFSGIVQIALIGRKYVMVGLQEYEHFTMGIASLLGNGRPLQSRQLDDYLKRKAGQALDLLLVHPIIIPRSIPQ